jgi:hypothetical protein
MISTFPSGCLSVPVSHLDKLQKREAWNIEDVSKRALQ